MQENHEQTKTHLHPFHILPPSPWPIITAVSVLILTVGAVLAMHKLDHWTWRIGLFSLALTLCGWWRDVVDESNTPGTHTLSVQRGLKIGMGLFIVSEVMFFMVFFWSYFHAFLIASATTHLWPPKGIIPMNPYRLPYLNTLLLLLSGTTVTWAHHALTQGDMSNTAKALLITVFLGFTFTSIQAFEYLHAAFSIKDGVYSSNFYMATGFHGLHVIIGSIFLLVCFIRTKRLDFTATHHVGFEAASWYWHFVDVVWLFLFVSIYWGGYNK